MVDWKKEKPLIETEGLIKGLYSLSNTPCWFVQLQSEERDLPIGDVILDLIDNAPRKKKKIASFVQVGIPIRKIVEGLLVQRKRGLNE